MLIFSVIVALFFSSCAEVSTKSVLEDSRFAPKISINSVKLKSINLDSLILESNISITNSLPLGVNIKDAMINIYYEDKIINSYKIEGENTLKSRSTSKINLDSSIRINDLVKMIKDYTTRDSLPFKLEVATIILLPNNNATKIAKSTLDLIREVGDSSNVSESNSADSSTLEANRPLKIYDLREKFDINIPTINPKITLKDLDFSLTNISAKFNISNATKTKFMLENISYNLALNGIDFSGEARSEAQNDGSIDIIIDNLQNAFSFTASQKTSIILNANLKIDGINYAIPLRIEKDFK